LSNLFDGRFLGAPWPIRVVTREELMDCYQLGKVDAQGIEAGTDGTPKEVQPEGREPGPKDAP